MNILHSFVSYSIITLLGLLGGNFGGNGNENVLSTEHANKVMSSEVSEKWKIDGIEWGNMKNHDFIVNNTLKLKDTTLHFSSNFPENFESDKEYNLYIALPGWEGLYFQGLGTNIRDEKYVFEAKKYKDNLIIISPQLDDWGEKSASDTIALVEYFKNHYNISKVYISGVSGGGETLSIVLGKRPKLFTAALFIASQRDGDYETLAKQRTPLYIAIGENDSYYGSKKAKDAYKKLHSLYEEQGLNDENIEEILVLDVKPHEYFTQRGFSDEHMGGCISFAFEEDIMSWLFDK